MSSHILLSRGVAGPSIDSDCDAEIRPTSPTLVTSFFESGTRHVMTLGDAASHNISALDGADGKGKGKGKGKEIDVDEPSNSTSNKPSYQSTIDSEPIPKRPISRSGTFFDNPTDPRAILDDNILEPCPQSRVRSSVSEILHGDPLQKSASDDGIHASLRRSFTMLSGPSQPASALTEVFSECQPLFPAPTFPPNKSLHALADIGHLEFMASRSDFRAQRQSLEARPNPAGPFQCALKLWELMLIPFL
ncbi:hypothetical protein LZ554_002268 [Drepanopeziza brunnea f. sp. 'monogermtubi']|nr:hypothetical protein LZ554_002268 [Drepanopeziza brunnea f. sp. 'monogermtubi']